MYLEEWAGVIWEVSVHSSQFGSEPKTALKNIVLQKNETTVEIICKLNLKIEIPPLFRVLITFQISQFSSKCLNVLTLT